MTRRPLLLATLLTVTGCASTQTRFWTVEPVAPIAAAAPRSAAPIQIAAVHLPLGLDRLEIVQHDEADRVRVMDFDRWSAPPGSLLRSALTQDLVARLPSGGVVFPDSPAPAATRRITVDVLDFRRVDDRYVMQVDWTIAAPDAHPHPLRLDTPAGLGTVAAQTTALGDLMSQLADRIAAG